MDTNAEKFRAWFKRTPLYFWLVLVIWEALKQAVPFAEFKGRVMELVISLVAGLVSVILLGQTGQIPDAGVNLFTLAIWLGVTVILRFVYGGFTIPAKLYQKMETVANLTSWIDVGITEFEFPRNGDLCSIGLEMISHKPRYEEAGNSYEPYLGQVHPKLKTLSKTDEHPNRNFSDDLSSLLPLMQGNTYFQRAENIKSLQQLKRDKQSHTAIEIAQWNSDGAWIRIGKKDNEQRVSLDEGTPYFIQIEIKNAIVYPTEATMNPCLINCELLYEIEKEGSKTVSVKITSRYLKEKR